MRPLWSLLFLFALLGSLEADPAPAGSPGLRSGYRAVSGALPDGRLAFRAWTEAGGGRLLAVDPATLETAVVPGLEADLVPDHGRARALDRLRAAAGTRRGGLENSGLRRAEPPKPGAWLTFDLCPSRKPLDREVLVRLEADQKPLPVLLGVSGRWIDGHPEDFAWLQAERDGGRLALTWVNHTENHPYLPGAPWDQNFLLLPGTDLGAEVFGVEQRLLDRGEVPSVLFRFPGLVSSPELFDRIAGWGLVPLGASAWLAKQQPLRSGTLVLTHANGNEPEGLTLLEAWDRTHRDEIRAGRWSWLGLEDMAASRW